LADTVSLTIIALLAVDGHQAEVILELPFAYHSGPVSQCWSQMSMNFFAHIRSMFVGFIVFHLYF
jgi:hypothetical protein